MPAPTRGSITQGFGPTNEPLDGPYQGYAHFNKGIDFGAPEGTPVTATVAGTVVSAGDSGDGWGISVKIRDARGYVHNYGHLASAGVQVGAKVAAGANVGKVGNTGKSTGPHLSYDVADETGTYIDPSRFFSDDGQGAGGAGDTGPYPSPGAGGSDDGGLGAAIVVAKKRTADLAAKFGQTNSDEDFFLWKDAQADLWDLQDRLTTAEDRDYEYGERAFKSGVELGDYTLRQADSAYGRWADKRDAAQIAAKSQQQDTLDKNQAIVDTEAARAESSTPGLLPRSLNAGYYDTAAEDVLKRYMDKFGVGAEPPGPEGYSGPALPQRAAKGEPLSLWPGQTLAGDNSGTWGASGNPSEEVLRGPRSGAGFDPYGNDVDPTGFGLSNGQTMITPDGKRVTWGRDSGDGGGGGGGWKFGADMFPSPRRILEGAAAPSIAAGWAAKQALGASQKSKKWWKKLGKGISRFADGTESAPGGMAMMGEKGPEMMIDPATGEMIPVGQFGPEVRDVPQGAAVIPTGVPEDEAFAYSQISGAMSKGPKDPGQQQYEAQMRAADPDLQAKVMASLQKAMAAHYAADPPLTPTLEPGMKDYWANWRPLTTPPPPPPQPQPQGVV